ncbi:MAG: hypothetical protein ACLFWL_16905 [Candidatus Brocadiia bacterium]
MKFRNYETAKKTNGGTAKRRYDTATTGLVPVGPYLCTTGHDPPPKGYHLTLRGWGRTFAANIKHRSTGMKPVVAWVGVDPW